MPAFEQHGLLHWNGLHRSTEMGVSGDYSGLGTWFFASWFGTSEFPPAETQLPTAPEVMW